MTWENEALKVYINEKEIINIVNSLKIGNEEFVKNLIVTPVLIHILGMCGWTTKKIFDSLSYSKEGSGEVDIKIKLSSSLTVLIEVKNLTETLKIGEAKKRKINDKISLKKELREPVLLMKEPINLLNLNNDIWGQTFRYLINEYIQNPNQEKITLILTNSKIWKIAEFSQEELNEILNSLKRGDDIEASEKINDIPTNITLKALDLRDWIDKKFNSFYLNEVFKKLKEDWK